MISKTTLKEYEFKTIEDYFNYIVDSKINGQYSQVKHLIKQLSKDQKLLLFRYLKHDKYKGFEEDIYYILECLWSLK